MAHNRSNKHGNNLPKTIHAVPVYGHPYIGNGEDFRKWYKCGWCGFMCKLGREELGGAETSSGTSYEDVTSPSDPFAAGADKSVPANNMVIEGQSGDFVLMELDSSGDLKEVLHDFQSVVSGGCPQCGSKNWRGDYS